MTTIYSYDATASGYRRWWFSSHFISSAQRLPCGNTLITEGSHGRVFEVTSDGKIVWGGTVWIEPDLSC